MLRSGSSGQPHSIDDTAMTITDALANLGVRDVILSEEEKAFFDAQGYLPLPAVMSAAEVTALVNRLEELAEEEGDDAGKEVHQEGGTMRLSNLIDKGTVFEKCITDPRVLTAIRHIVGSELRLSSLNARASLPGRGLQGIHADWGEGVQVGDYHVCNSIWLLTDFTTENGATRVVPGSHLSGKVPSEEMASTTDPHPDDVQLLAPAGTVVVFNGHLWHGGTHNRSDNKRWAMHGYFCRRSVSQQTDQRQWLSQETVSRLSPAARAVVDVNASWEMDVS